MHGCLGDNTGVSNMEVCRRTFIGERLNHTADVTTAEEEEGIRHVTQNGN